MSLSSISDRSSSTPSMLVSSIFLVIVAIKSRWMPALLDVSCNVHYNFNLVSLIFSETFGRLPWSLVFVKCSNYDTLREYRQKKFVTLSGFCPLRDLCVCVCVCGGGGGLVNPLKKEKFLTKIFFSNNVEWSSKNLWKMISADVKDNKNNKK